MRESRDILLIRACCRDLLLDPAGATLLRDRARDADPQPEDSFVHHFTELLLAPDFDSKAVAADAALGVLTGIKQGGAGTDYVHGLFLLGWSEVRLRRNPVRAVELLRSALTEADNHRLKSLVPVVRSNLAFAMTYAGQFGEAEEILNGIASEVASQTAADWDQFEGGLFGTACGYILFWRGQVADSQDWFTSTAAAGGLDTSFAALSRVYRALAVARLGLAERYDETEWALSAVSSGDKHGVPWGSYRRLALAYLLEARGAVGKAMATAEPLLQYDGIPVTHALIAELYRRNEQPGRAVAFLRRINPVARPTYVHVSMLATLAGMAYSDGKTKDAFGNLDRALTVAGQCGAYLPLLATDTAFTELLEAYAHSGSAHERLLGEVFTLREQMTSGRTSELTARELELLSYLRTTMTAQEIAGTLHISLATVKTHMRSIYNKLGVNNRRDAVRTRL